MNEQMFNDIVEMGFNSLEEYVAFTLGIEEEELDNFYDSYEND